MACYRVNFTFTFILIGALAKLQKLLLASSCLSVCPSARTVRLRLDEFSYSSILVGFTKIYREYSRLVKIGHTNGHEDLHSFMTALVTGVTKVAVDSNRYCLISSCDLYYAYLRVGGERVIVIFNIYFLL